MGDSSLCPPSCRRDGRRLKRGAPLPLCPSDHHHCPLLGASLAPCCWRSCRPCRHAGMRPCSNAAAIVGAARGANVRHPMCHCHCQGPAGPGFVRFVVGVWWLCVVGHCRSLFIVHCPSVVARTPLLFIVVVICCRHTVSSPRVLQGGNPQDQDPTPFNCHCCKSDGHGHTSAAVEYYCTVIGTVRDDMAGRGWTASPTTCRATLVP